MKFYLLTVIKVLLTIAIASYWLNARTGLAGTSEIQITDKSGNRVVLYRASYALIIWEGNYQHWSKLRNVEAEANQVKDALERQGFEVTIVGNKTGDQLRQVMNNFIAQYGYQKDNRLLIFYTGHGYSRNQNNTGYLVPIDAFDPIQDQTQFLQVAIGMEEVMGWARRIEAKHALFVFDSCFSGTMFKTKSLPNVKDAYIRTVMDKPVRAFLTAGDAGEEVPAKSVFTPLFIRAIEGEADLNKDGYVTGIELGVFVSQRLPDYTQNRQSPQFGKIRDVDLDRGEIVFRPLLELSIPAVVPVPRVSPSPEPKPIRQPSVAPQLTAEALFESGWKKENAGDKQGAIADYNQAIKLNPNYAYPYNGRGNVKGDLGDKQGAIADYTQAIKLKPDLAFVIYSNRGNAKSDLGDNQGAIADYNQAIKLEPNYDGAYFGRGHAKHNLGDNQGAIDDYTQAIKLTPSYLYGATAQAYVSRGDAKDDLGDKQGAIDDYTKVIQLNPKPEYDNAYFYYSRGLAKRNLGDKQGALSDFQTAANLFQKQGNTKMYQDARDRIQKLQK